MTLDVARGWLRRLGYTYETQPKATLPPNVTLERIRNVYAQLGRPLSWSDVAPIVAIEARARWGSWLEACAAAGVPGRGKTQHRQDRADRDVLRSAVSRYVATADKPTWKGWMTWAKEHEVRGHATRDARLLVSDASKFRRRRAIAAQTDAPLGRPGTQGVLFGCDVCGSAGCPGACGVGDVVEQCP
jgi:hypothetical protein